MLLMDNYFGTKMLDQPTPPQTAPRGVGGGRFETSSTELAGFQRSAGMGGQERSRGFGSDSPR
jgi:hypothetical protein